MHSFIFSYVPKVKFCELWPVNVYIWPTEDLNIMDWPSGSIQTKQTLKVRGLQCGNIECVIHYKIERVIKCVILCCTYLLWVYHVWNLVIAPWEYAYSATCLSWVSAESEVFFLTNCCFSALRGKNQDIRTNILCHLIMKWDFCMNKECYNRQHGLNKDVISSLSQSGTRVARYV